MSAWYVLAAIGIHPLCPGDGRWYLCAPVFDKTVISVAEGRTFTILSKRDVVGPRIVSLNGNRLNRPWITTEEILSGGVLEIAREMR